MFIIPDLAPVAFTKIVTARKKYYTLKIIECGNVSGNVENGFFCWVAYRNGEKVTRPPKAVWQEGNRLCNKFVSVMPYCLVTEPFEHTHKFVDWTTHEGRTVTGCRDCGKIK